MAAMEMSVHLCFDGRCEEAFRFYEQLLGGQIVTMLPYAKAPMEVAADWRDKIVHATMMVGALRLSGADVAPEQYQRPQGFYVLLSPAVDAGQRIFAALSENGTVVMPLQKTFWSPSFGVVVDRFGIPWEVSC
jgi:PhnB protein